MIHAIILAAGQSRRMGRQKLLLPYHGKSVIEHIVTQAIGGGLSDITVVLGHDAAEIAAKLAPFPVKVVVNAQYAEGMITSVRCGLETMAEDARAALIILGDQPDISGAVLSQLIDGSKATSKGITVPVFEGRRGHPILVSMKYRDEIMTQYGDVGLRGLLAEHPDDIAEIQMNHSGVVQDMDTPEDYVREMWKLRD